MYKYIYAGPVLEFDKCIAGHWTGETTAPSMSKARSNLIFQFKKQYNRAANAKITLPGKIVLAGKKGSM